MAVDRLGDVYVGEASGRIRKIAPNGLISTIAGTGVTGFSGDGGLATAAQLSTPIGLAIDVHGNLYVADGFNHRVRMVTANGIITTVAGNGDPGPEGFGGYSGDGGPAVSARLSIPSAVAVDSQGNLYIADGNNDRIRKVGPDGVIHTVVGPVLTVTDQHLDPAGIAFDRAGNLYIADNGELLIWKMAPDGAVTKVAGRGFPPGDSPNCTAALQAAFGQALSIAVDESGDIYFADAADNKVREVSREAKVSTVAGNGAHGYFASGQATGDGGPATQVALGSPPSVAVGASGDIYIADEANMRVRKVIAPRLNPTICT